MDPRIEKILKLPRYQRSLIVVAVMVLVAGAFYWFMYMPKHKEYTNLQQRNASLELKLQQDRRIANNLPKFRAEYEKMKQQLESALKELPNKKEIPTLLTSIAALAKDNGLEVLRFQPGGEAAKGFYAEVPVSLKLVGSYNEVASFSYDVGNMSRIVNLSNLSLTGPKSEPGRTVLAIDCLATTFRFIEEASK